MDDTFKTLLWLFLGIIGVFVTVMVAIPIFRSRCPSCGKLFAAKIASSTREVAIDTSEWGFDAQRNEHRNIPMHREGFLITRVCKHCGVRWDRMETTGRQTDRLTDAEAEAYRAKRF